MKNTIAKIATLVLTLSAASFASASPFVTITDNYLYESLIQAEFDIENRMNAEIVSSAHIKQDLVLIAESKAEETRDSAAKAVAE